MSLNQAAWINSAGQKPLTVGAAPMPKPGPKDIVIKNAAVAIVRQETPNWSYSGCWANIRRRIRLTGRSSKIDHCPCLKKHNTHLSGITAVI